MLDALKANNMPPRIFEIEAPKAAQVYSQYQISFNCSLNGDLNMRVFEVLSATGCLLTDRLSAETGISHFFKDGQDLILYDNEDDLIEKARWYLQRPEHCLRIAKYGHQTYLKHFSEPQRREQFLRFIFGDAEDIKQQSQAMQGIDPRCNRPLATYDDFFQRAAAYDRLQVLAYTDLIKEVQCDSDLTPLEYFLSDISDLRFKSLCITNTSAKNPDECCIVLSLKKFSELVEKADLPAHSFIPLDAKLKQLAPLADHISRHQLRLIHSPMSEYGCLLTRLPQSAFPPYCEITPLPWES
jgi:hypothetical protein